MQAEIRLSTSENPSPEPWVWRVWDQGRLVARGQSPSELEAQQAVRVLMGHDHSSVAAAAKALAMPAPAETPAPAVKPKAVKRSPKA
jgi:hypothetical protein